jgi:hypothetical protein
MKLPWQVFVAAALGLALVGPAVAVVPSGSDKDRPVDQELLKQLNARSTDDVDRELFGPDGPKGKPAARPPGDAVAPAKPNEPPADRTGGAQRQLPRPGGAEKGAPLVDIARQMRRVEALIAQAECGQKTQDIQEDILKELEDLLEQMKKRCQGQGECKPGTCKPGACKNPQCKNSKKGFGGNVNPGGNPARNPNPQPSQAKVPMPKPTSNPIGSGANPPNAKQRAALQGAVWGDLPAQDRERMTQLPDQQFLPKYETLIGDYFRRLAEQKENPGNGP